MKRTIALLLALVCVIPFFFSCAEKQKAEEYQQPEQLAFGSYLRSNGSEYNGFSISLNENGSFSYYESPFSSHAGEGNYTFENGIVTLIDEQIPTVNGTATKTFRFRYTGDSLIFLADTSDQFMYIKLPDQAEFIKN